MQSYTAVLLTFVASYLLGAIPFGWLMARWRGVDLLKQGSGNIGATNVGRVLGMKYGVLVFVLDFAKGALPVVVAQQVAPGELPREAFEVTAGIAAFLGHLFPVYLRFRGGKGVATGAGVVAVLVPVPALAAILTWIVAVVLTRYVSVASMLAAAVICAAHLALTPQPWAWPANIVSSFCLVASALVVVKHIGNMRRLLAGTENRFKESPAMMLFSKTLHVLSLGLWFGTVAFFTLSGSLMFEAFKAESRKTADQRELWFPLPREFMKEPPSPKFPTPLAEEQGTRAFGFAVTPLFPWFYGIQLVCAFIAFGTALSWQRGREKEKVQSWRTWLLLLALIVTLVGWALESKVTEMRKPRNQRTDDVLLARDATPAQIMAAENARSEFGKWHGYSLMQNFASLLLVTIVMALAAQLPADKVQVPGTSEEQNTASGRVAATA